MGQDEPLRKQKDDPVSDLGTRIKYWRLRADLKAVGLARAIDMSESSVSKWENNKQQDMPQHTLAKICEALGIDLSTFWGEMPAVVDEAEAS